MLFLTPNQQCQSNEGQEWQLVQRDRKAEWYEVFHKQGNRRQQTLPQSMAARGGSV